MSLLPSKIRNGEVETPDLLCGGTPCQAFSVAGLRQSLDDARCNLTLTFCEIADAIDSKREQPCIVFWENVPGVLNTKDNAFGCFLGALAGEDDALVAPGGRWANAGFIDGPQRAVAWRVLDAQYFGVAQRRRRVFVIASARADFDPAAVLFEFEGVRRDTAPSRETGQVAPTIPSRSTAGGGLGTDFDCDGGLQPYTVANCLTQRMHKGINSTLDEGQTPVLAPMAFGGDIARTLQARYDSSPCVDRGMDVIAQPIAFSCKDNGRDATLELTPTLRSMTHSNSHPNGGGQLAVAQPFQQTTDCLTAAYGTKWNGNASADNGSLFANYGMAVRRLTPVECERLQGFPDSYTNIPWRKQSESPDGPRYKALGNSWAVPVVRWIGERIERSLA
jgi:DNA (cytosine-5)-methyltransferase 1